MVVQDLDVLVYSSHKTASQTAVQTLRGHGLRVCHCHKLTDLFLTLPEQTTGMTSKELQTAVLEDISNRWAARRKLTVLTLLRNPLERLVSSFFQSFHSDEVHFQKKNPDQTTVSTHNARELWQLFLDKVRQNALPGRQESVDELGELIGCSQLAERVCKKLESSTMAECTDLPVRLVALDFDAAVSDMAGALRRALRVPIEHTVDSNVSSAKRYFSKYQALRQRAGESPEYKAAVRAQYRPCFFRERARKGGGTL